jgi:hypothetical protein
MGPAMSEVIVRALAAACRDPEVLAKLRGPLGDAARAQGAAWADRATRARWAATARTPVPAGIRGVHPSWIEAGLVGLPERARAAVASGGGDAVDTWLARWATAGIPPMPPITAPRVTSIDTVTRVDAIILAHWLEEVGADQLALALTAAGEPAIAAAAERVGARLIAAAARIAVAPRVGALGRVRAAIERCRVVLDGRALHRIGARAIAPHLHALVRRQIMYRLPRALGQIVGDELAAARHATLGEAPRWVALTA